MNLNVPWELKCSKGDTGVKEAHRFHGSLNVLGSSHVTRVVAGHKEAYRP